MSDCRSRSYLGALLGNDGHGRAADVAGTHTANLEIPFAAHGCIVFSCGGGVAPKTETKRKMRWRFEASALPATCHEYENSFDNKLLCNFRIYFRKTSSAMCQIGTKSFEMECSGRRRSKTCQRGRENFEWRQQ